MRPRQHARGLVFVEEFEPHEQPQHRTAKRLGQHPRYRARDPQEGRILDWGSGVGQIGGVFHRRHCVRWRL